MLSQKSEGEDKLAYKLSPSSLNLMKECPRCFWLTQHKVWKRPDGAFPTLPAGVDRILKTHFDRFRDKNELPPELCNNGECIGLKLFNDKEKLKIWQSNFKGISIKDKNGNALHGAVDDLLIKGDKIIVFDFKTRGYPCKEDTHKSYQNQLDIYNYLLRKNGHNTEDFAYLLFYVPKEVLPKGEVIFDTELKKIKVNVKNAENVFESAIKLLNSDCPTKSCDWCKGR